MYGAIIAARSIPDGLLGLSLKRSKVRRCSSFRAMESRPAAENAGAAALSLRVT